MNRRRVDRPEIRIQGFKDYDGTTIRIIDSDGDPHDCEGYNLDELQVQASLTSKSGAERLIDALTVAKHCLPE